MSRDSGKSITIIVILSGVLALIFMLAARGGRDRPVLISTTHVGRQDLSSWIATNGKIEPIDPRIIQSQLTTFIETVHVKEGQMVSSGQVLMTLDAKDLMSELAHMREQLVAAEMNTTLLLMAALPTILPKSIRTLSKRTLKSNACAMKGIHWNVFIRGKRPRVRRSSRRKLH